MALVLILIKQIVVMFLLVAVGYLLFRTNKITQETSKAIANLLIYVSLPCVIVRSFLVERTAESVKNLGISALLAAAAIAISIVVSHVMYRKDPIAAFSSAFANPGFFGIPLILATLGGDAVFFVAAFIFFTNMGQWTYGVSILTGKGSALKLKNILTAPFLIAILVGLFFFLTGIPMPGIVSNCVSLCADLNTPLAMFSIGVYLAQTDLKKMVTRKSLYLITISRQLLIPALTLGLLCVIPAPQSLKLAILIASACPVGSNVAVYAQLHGKDYAYAVETVVISTLFSVVTIPALVTLSQLLWPA